MKGYDFYRMPGPLEWAGPPKKFSYSSLSAIERCPLQWQLSNSKYSEDLDSFPARPAPAAIEGQIVHSVLEKLFKALSLEGLPNLNTPEFRSCIGRVNIKNAVNLLVEKHNKKIARHPRGNGFRLRLTCQQMSNQIVRLFKSQYSHIASSDFSPVNSTSSNYTWKKGVDSTSDPIQLLDTYGALTEFYLRDKTISFEGVVDLVRKEGGQVVITDFKTGRKDENHVKQVSYYAVLWKRITGKTPSKVELQYPGSVVTIPMSESFVSEVEEELRERISSASEMTAKRPADAFCDNHCMLCDVRQFCGNYWNDKSIDEVGKGEDNTTLDIDIMVDGEPGDFGFEGKTNCGQNIAVVYDSSVEKILGPFKNGDHFRILRAVYKKVPQSIELKPWTEIFYRL